MAPKKTPTESAQKSVKPSKAHEGKKNKKRRQETFSIYIYKVLK